MTMAERIDAASFEERVLKADKPVLVDFYSDTCIPCKRLNPQLTKLEEARAGELIVVKVNINFDTQVAVDNGVMAAPTLVLFQGGKEAGRTVGFKALKELEEFIDGALA